MKYEAKLPKTNVNVSKQKPLRELFTLLLGALAFIFVLYQILDFSLDFAIKHITPKQEKKLFSYFSQKIFADLQEDKNVQNMLDGLSKCANIPYPLKVKIQEDKQSNAFAYPGGQIIVFSNLIKTSTSQNSLAFVLSHEIGHFKNKDHLRGISKNIALSFLFAILTNGDLDILKNTLQMKYSQSHEAQADKIALEILNCYYSHVGGADEFFKSIQKTEAKFEIFDYFSTHPQTKKRIQNIHKLTKQKGYKVQKTLPMW